MVMQFKCPNCNGIFYVNPPVLKQKKTRCPYCHKLQAVEDYARTGFHDDIFRTKEEREAYSKAINTFIMRVNEKLKR